MSEKAIIGILVDVSGSMKESLQINVALNDNNVSKIQTVIKTIFYVFKNETDSNNTKEVFAVAFGLKGETDVCDLLALVRLAVNIKSQINVPRGKFNLNELLKSKEINYAKEFIDKHLSDEECAFIFALSSTEEGIGILDKIINSLPAACKYGAVNMINGGANTFLDVTSLFGLLHSGGALKNEYEARKTKEVAKDGKERFMAAQLRQIQRISVFHIFTAVGILENALDERAIDGQMNKNKLDMIIKHLEPFIYGSTPMCKALKLAQPLFSSTYEKKILFLITDGDAKDGNPAQFSQKFKDMGITVIVCLLTSRNFQHPKQLYYSDEGQNWREWEKHMFDLSTAVDNTHPMLSILLERGWNLAPEGHSKLFFQANNPQIISEIGDIISAENNDLVLNIITRATLEEYINLDALMEKKEIKSPQQVGGTCYANASAYVIYLSLKRIYKREGRDVTFEELRKDMIGEFGNAGARTITVLEKYCQKYRLQCAMVDENGAKIAVSRRRAVVARFALSEDQWNDFCQFYLNDKKGILKQTNLRSATDVERSGHAVILVKVTPEYLLFMNSWGARFADDGFFRVENAAVLNIQFFDVFWTNDNLTPGEKAAYEEMKKSGANLIDKIPSSVKVLPYTCPKCKQSSPANTFEGHFQEAQCPKCKKNFSPCLFNFSMFN